jgi:NADPH-ferrihemoprotein reductase
METVALCRAISAIPIDLQALSQLSYDDAFVLPFLLLGGAYYLGNGILWGKPDPYEYIWYQRPQLKGQNTLAATKVQSRNIAEKLAETSSNIVVFWGSQSGTAEGFAHRLARELRRRFRQDALVADLSDYDPQTITLIPQTKVAIFIMSTYGEGDPADNSWDFINWLKSQEAGASLKNLRYASFGLGNSKYKFYNKVIDDVVALLETLQATSLLPVTKGDEAARSTEEDFVEWKDDIIGTLASTLDLIGYEPEYEATINVIEDESLARSDLSLRELVQQHTFKKRATNASAIVSLPVIEQREHISSSANHRGCAHLTVDLSKHPQIKYKTGDHIAVWPINPDSEVRGLLQILGLEDKMNTPIKISPLKEDSQNLRVPAQTTYQALFQNHLEICAPVPRETVLALVQFASTDKVKSFLKTIGKSKDAYTQLLKSNHFNFARLLQYTGHIDSLESWLSLPLSFVIERIPPMKPRYYSISSSSITTPRKVSMTVARKPTPLTSNPEITIPGLTSSYLSTADLPSIYAQIIPSTFKLPFNATIPIIMVAAGTGIAPFRGFLHDRARLASNGRPIGQMLLFFGCQSEQTDYLYREELAELLAAPLKDKLKLITAFSRMGGEKKYVQHRVAEENEEVSRLLLEEDAAFYVCGAASMARSVESAINASIARRSGGSEAEVEAWRRDRRRAKKWHEDVWG